MESYNRRSVDVGLIGNWYGIGLPEIAAIVFTPNLALIVLRTEVEAECEGHERMLITLLKDKNK